jgi:hypothetical protein
MMISSEWLNNLRIAHGSYNAIIFVCLLYQGWLGITIRRRRKTGGERVSFVRKHRANGPVLAVLGVLGYLGGVSLIWIDRGRCFVFPYHATTGMCIASCLILTFLISREIKGAESRWRTPHFLLGILILGLYLVQALLGLDILF